MWWILLVIIAVAISPILAEIAVVAYNGKGSQVLPFLLFYTVPAGSVALVVWLAVAAYRTFWR